MTKPTEYNKSDSTNRREPTIRKPHRILTATLLLTVCCGCSRPQARHVSEFVHREPNGATYVSGMTHKIDGAGLERPASDQGWGGSTITVGVAAGEAQFAFVLLSHRSGADFYQVVRTLKPKHGASRVDKVDVSYGGTAFTLFEDDVGTATLRPPTRKPH